MNKADNIFREPRYGVVEAAKLLGMNHNRVRRWLKGYQYRNTTETIQLPPVVICSDDCINFLSLIELRFIQTFLEQGISLQKVRAALKEASTIYETEYPFSSRRFFTNGRDIFIEIKNNDSATSLLELLSDGQWVFAPFILAFAQQIEFDHETDLAVRWWPRGRNSQVVIDPAFGFGRPVLATKSVKTANIYDLYIAEGKNKERVCDWLGITMDEVTLAIEFEEQMAA